MKLKKIYRYKLELHNFAFCQLFIFITSYIPLYVLWSSQDHLCGLQSMGSQRVGQDLVSKEQQRLNFAYIRFRGSVIIFGFSK